MSRTDRDQRGGHRHRYWSKRRSNTRQYLQRFHNRKLRRAAKHDVDADGRTRHQALWNEH